MHSEAMKPRSANLAVNNGSHLTARNTDILNCPEWLLTGEAGEIVTLVVLGVINVTVIGGNLLVIFAVFASRKLRTVTNFFIVSLAAADLLVGLAVLPYSISLEVLDVWIFGAVWCQMWLAVDVWMCTSSILNLCAISLDRYIAITRPVHYRNIMTPQRAKLLIASVWVLSFVICFPPLVGWNDSKSMGARIATFNVTDPDKSFLLQRPEETTTVTDASVIGTSHGYPLPSSNFQSLPVQKRTNTPSMAAPHKSYENPSNVQCSVVECVLINNKGYVIYSALGSFYIPLLVMLFFYWRIYSVAITTSRALSRGFRRTKSRKKRESSKGEEQRVTLRMHRGNKFPEIQMGPKSANGCRTGVLVVSGKDSSKTTTETKSTDNNPRLSKHINGTPSRARSKRVLKRFRKRTTSQENEDKDSLNEGKSGKAGRSFFSRMSSRNAKLHAKRFWSETKATKTVGVIVGGFICCWLPFFVIYLIRAFCENCFPALLFSIFFWLGYCNSVVNPFIYAHFSKDFRFAFKQILCRCKLRDEGVSTLIRQIHMTTFFEEPYGDENQEQDSSEQKQ